MRFERAARQFNLDGERPALDTTLFAVPGREVARVRQMSLFA